MDWRARDVASFCQRLAVAPREFARMVYFPPSADFEPTLAIRCELCFEFAHVLWPCHWTDTRLAMRRLGQAPGREGRKKIAPPRPALRRGGRAATPFVG